MFEEYAWETVRRNYRLRDGWTRFEQPTLPSGSRPDNVLMNKNTEDFVVVEMKDVAELTQAHIAQVLAYIEEIGASRGFLVIAADTYVPPYLRRSARRKRITIRRLTGWRG